MIALAKLQQLPSRAVGWRGAAADICVARKCGARVQSKGGKKGDRRARPGFERTILTNETLLFYTFRNRWMESRLTLARSRAFPTAAPSPQLDALRHTLAWLAPAASELRSGLCLVATYSRGIRIVLDY